MNEIYNVATIKGLLLKSHWPKCNELAECLYEIGTQEAKDALLDSLKAKRHHIRTAAIKSLTKFQDEALVEHIRPLLNDPAYETRMQAIDTIKELTGEDVVE